MKGQRIGGRLILLIVRHSQQFGFVTYFSVVGAILIAVSPDIGVSIIPVIFIMLPRLMGERATLFLAALPIRAREILLARILLMLALMWLPLVTWIVVAAVHPPSRDFTEISLNGKLELLGIATLAILLPNLVRIGALKVPLLQAVVFQWTALAIISVLALAFPSSVTLTVLVLSIAASLWYIWAKTPHSFQLATSGTASQPAISETVSTPSEVASSHPLTSMDRARESPANGSQPVAWWRAIVRSVVTRMTVLSVILAFVTGMGDNWPIFFALYLVMLLVMIRPQTRWMYGLPISRRNFMLTNVVPALAPMLCGLVVAAFVSPLTFHSTTIAFRAPSTDASQAQFHRHTRVTLDFWELAPVRQAPILRAPWGETGASDTLSVLGLTLYNPYSAEKTSSKQFLDWQVSRATQAVYGRAVPLAARESDRFAWPLRINTPGVYVLGAGMVISFALLVVFFVELPRWYRFSRRPAMRVGVVVLGCAFLLGLALLDMHYTRTRETNVAARLVGAAIRHLADVLPGGFIAATVLASLPVLAMVFVLQWQFGRSEFADRVKQEKGWGTW